jgi:hypothetical protein
VQEHRHAPFGDRDPAREQGLVDLRHAALLARAQLANERDDVEAKLALGQRPGARFFGHVRATILRAGRGHTAANTHGQAPEPVEAHDRAMVMIGHP